MISNEALQADLEATRSMIEATLLRHSEVEEEFQRETRASEVRLSGLGATLTQLREQLESFAVQEGALESLLKARGGESTE